MEADFFYSILSRKAFATNSLTYTFVWDVWFDGQIVCSMIEHLSNIDEITVSLGLLKLADIVLILINPSPCYVKSYNYTLTYLLVM
jgi:hypothetical protein